MLTAVEGTYRDGKIELTEVPLGVADEAAVIVTFIQPGLALSPGIDLRDLGIDREQPGMNAYDNYDAAKSGH